MSGFLSHTLSYWGAGGLLLFPLAGVCVGIWGYYLRSRDHFITILRETDHLDTHHLDSPSSEGLVSGFLHRVSEDISSGASPRTTYHLRQEECLGALQKDIHILSALTAAAPLLGLLGTVMGMIDTFDASTMLSGSTADKVAGGISQALITTQLGLIIALPGVFGVSRLRSLLYETQIRFSSIRAVILAPHLSSPEGVSP